MTISDKFAGIIEAGRQSTANFAIGAPLRRKYVNLGDQNKLILSSAYENRLSLTAIAQRVNTEVNHLTCSQLKYADAHALIQGIQILRQRHIHFQQKHPIKTFFLNLFTLGQFSRSSNLFTEAVRRIESELDNFHQQIKIELATECRSRNFTLEEVGGQSFKIHAGQNHYQISADREGLCCEGQERVYTDPKKLLQFLDEEEGKRALIQYKQTMSSALEGAKKQYLCELTLIHDSQLPRNVQLCIGDQSLDLLIESNKIIWKEKRYTIIEDLLRNPEIQQIIKAQEQVIRRQALLQIQQKSAQSSSPLDQWIVKQNQDWVAHAVWTNNAVQKIFQMRKVLPAEAVIRTSAVVEYEKGHGYAARGQAELPKLDSSDVDEINQLYVPLQKAEFGLIMSEEPPHQIKFNRFKETLELNDLLDRLAKKYRCGSQFIFIAFEQTLPSESRLDVALARRYQTFQTAIKAHRAVTDQPPSVQKRLEAQALQNLHPAFRQARTGIIPATKLNPEIRTLKSQVLWGYGEVAVLRGNTQEIIGHVIDNDGEHSLLAPWQNRGEFFALELQQEDTIVIGPRGVLEGFKEQAKRDGIKLFLFEEMTQDQLDYFAVPKQLRSGSP